MNASLSTAGTNCAQPRAGRCEGASLKFQTTGQKRRQLTIR